MIRKALQLVQMRDWIDQKEMLVAWRDAIVRTEQRLHRARREVANRSTLNLATAWRMLKVEPWLRLVHNVAFEFGEPEPVVHRESGVAAERLRKRMTEQVTSNWRKFIMKAALFV